MFVNVEKENLSKYKKYYVIKYRAENKRLNLSAESVPQKIIG